MRVVILAGGFGGAKMAHGFALEGERRAAAGEPPLELTIVGNTADDLELHGLHVSPDLDTLMYTLAGLANPDTGWGVRDETWSAAGMLGRYGEQTWFQLGDRDLATHIVRTVRLREGMRLTEVTDRLCRALGVAARLVPMTDDRMRTRVRVADGWLDFQDYFVRRRHRDDVLELVYDGVPDGRPTPEALAAIGAAELVVLAPSNPFVSIGPILELPGLLDALRAAPAPVTAVSPIVHGAALRGPAEQMLRTLAGDSGAAGIARHYSSAYRGLVDLFVVDQSDAGELAQVRAAGITPLALPIVMRSDGDRRDLAAALLREVGSWVAPFRRAE